MVRKKKKVNFIDQVMAKNMVRLREERGWSQVELAKNYGCKQSHISQLESGYRGFGADTQVHLAKALGVDVKELLEMPKGMMSGDIEVLWQTFTELQAGKNKDLFGRVINFLAEGPDEAVESLDGLLKILEKSTGRAT